MEVKTSLIEPFLERAGQYGQTTFELIKLKSLDKAADVMSTLMSRLFLIVAFSLFAFTLNIAIALWLGDLMGKNYYGFLVVASFYGLIAIIVFFTHSLIKARVNNSIITQMLN